MVFKHRQRLWRGWIDSDEGFSVFLGRDFVERVSKIGSASGQVLMFEAD